MKWRELDFEKHPSSHRRYERWQPADEAWKVETYGDGVWYARLRLGVHRFAGSGESRESALEAARVEAVRVRDGLKRALKSAAGF